MASDLVGLHGTDPASVYLAAWARLREPSVEAIDRALYDDRELIRMLGMRRTIFVVPRDLAGIVHASSTAAIAVRERRVTESILDAAGHGGRAGARLRELEAAALAVLDRLGDATGTELTAAEPRLAEKFVVAAGKKYESSQSIVTRVVFQLAAEGHVVRARPRGTWISGQVRWARLESWLGGPLGEWSTADAQSELVRRWLAAFGPGTPADIRWWTGWTMGDVKRALASLDTVEVDVDGGTGLVLAKDFEPEAAGPPEVALLPSLDPSVMGWTDRGWFLDPHGPALFDRNGNAGPTIWWDGRVVGGWAQRPSGEVVTRLLEDVGREGSEAVAVEAARLQDWIGPIRVTARFRTPIEQELSA